MFTYHYGALSGSEANAATLETGAAMILCVVTSTFIVVSVSYSCLLSSLFADTLPIRIVDRLECSGVCVCAPSW